MKLSRIVSGVGAALAGVAAHDLLQRRHSLLRAFPVLGHGRYLVEMVGPELRQYVVASNDEERPFSRDQRRYIYASSKGMDNYFGFGTDNDLEHSQDYPIIKQRTFSDVVPSSTQAHHGLDAWIPGAKVLGGARGRRHAFRPQSVVNTSAMSYGSLSGPAVEAINRGAALGGFWQNTGEGGLSAHHRHGGDLMLQIGTAYFGCRDEDGRFDLDRLVDLVGSAPVRAIEIKLSQGAKPGLGGVLPAAKITPEIAEIRNVPRDRDCVSPSRHTAFHDVDSMLDFVETIADATGLPVGIKSAVGDERFWEELAATMADGQRGVDFVTIDGGEGGTGAAPLVFADHVALPFQAAFPRAYSAFARRGISDRVVFIGSGKLGLPENALMAFAVGADLVNVAREAMLAVGCLQTLKCHEGTCPTGVATQNPWLTRALVPELKAERVARYVGAFRRDLSKLAEAVGVAHPSLVTAEDVELLDGRATSRTLREVLGYQSGWGQPSQADMDEVARLVRGPHPQHRVPERRPGWAVDRS
ncbi:FMN-binding glutamate synthase family protein [Nocardioides marmoribigeumensis]|uniref:Glutamate synthase domain-containing protein 2 n=1 Tax=Nocardioides marmoribigeumensis TaxID=433649 RepID=A0ABU2BZ08_9ACTN|nr:FMN-binding glutamate synthase family protein [Nocardioides marmoribigeumensis]MDR7363637.1 glutamate synthase domain-containing protein 2 [Nocardioides marmoribigeumensis]